MTRYQMKYWRRHQYRMHVSLAVVLSGLLFVMTGMLTAHATEPASRRGHLVTVYDRGVEKSFITNDQTVKAALTRAGMVLSGYDRVEPSLDQKLVADSYQVNIYRARPITVIDGTTRMKIMTAYQTPKQIVEHAGMTLRDEDRVNMKLATDFIADGAGLELTIDRAVPVRLKLYGTESTVYTQAGTVGEFLNEKAIEISTGDTVSHDASTPISPAMLIEIWRDGVQTVTTEQTIEAPIETIMDVNQPVGYQSVQSEGATGKRSVVYEVTIDKGREVTRKEIQNVVTKQPEKRRIVIGAKTSANPLTKAKGAQQYVDSRGVTHRETYYDLPMGQVMQACGAGGLYTIRPSDGAKVDKDGYVIIAANLANYPRCSVVETSMGLGKVYDTGGFAARHPHGFDLATDWSNGDGR